MTALGDQIAQQQRWHRSRMGDTLTFGGSSYATVTQPRPSAAGGHPQAAYLGVLGADLDGRVFNLDYAAFGTLPVAGDTITWRGNSYLATHVTPEIAAASPVALIIEGCRSTLDTTTMLNGTAALWRCTRTSDSAGGSTDSWASVTSYPCYLGRSQGQAERVEGERIDALSDWWCALPLTADAHPPDRLVIGGETYEVTDTDRGLTGAVILVARLRRINPI